MIATTIDREINFSDMSRKSHKEVIFNMGPEELKKQKLPSRKIEQFYHKEHWAIHRALKAHLMFESKQNVRIGQKNRGSQMVVYVHQKYLEVLLEM